MFELPGVFCRPFHLHLHPIENLLRCLCISLLRMFSLLYQKWHHLSRIFMSCIQKGLSTGKESALVRCSEAVSHCGWAHADVQLWESVFICLHSNSGQRFQQDVVLPYLWFCSFNFSITVNQYLTFQMKGSDWSLSGQTAKSISKER